MNEERLIKLVRKHKALYDLNDPNYDVRNKRDYAWQEIGDKMKHSARDCRDKWKRLRDNYRRALKLRNTKTELGAKCIKRIKYEKLLWFINPYLRDDIEQTYGISQSDSLDSSNDASILEDIQSPATCSSEDSVSNHPICKITTTQQVTIPEPLPIHSSQQAHSETYTHLERDQITAFFISLIETVKDFPEDVQISVKRKIFKIVNDSEELVYKNKSQNEQVLLNCLNEKPELI